MQRANAAPKVQGFIWDFASDNPAVGVYNSPIAIPAGVMIRGAFLHVLTTWTGGGATIDVGYGGNGLFLTGMNPQVAGYREAPAGSAIVLSTGALITFTIIGAPITAGKIKFVFPYYESF